ncbi:rhodanese domain-containing protein [Thecamonas trahens ATCC 50062]|uniref:Rhodanese domain-containing protein n=1 Tax=Thecamonas trahens ATCC 50062 TaxID=461836 RepID=A0A0L0D1P9_THETB|nr:rhodanese domain-containing protein [Thecamonas trahens ATCC 50062]KNC46055.1 rhodanese domain-containing protein [Thecamonas trahens ATCC 50062]|eukprot:XP_013763035.1 rhodanese domain-containing protein [Thecamonas trahens ATCC 50062]
MLRLTHQITLTAARTSTLPQLAMVGSIAKAELKTKLEDGVYLIDVRTPDEVASTGIIPHAVNVPLDAIPPLFEYPSEESWEDAGLPPLPPKDTPIIFYCRSGARSGMAANYAEQAGWTNTINYEGSWLDWSPTG